jgi:hypothetical protein
LYEEEIKTSKKRNNKKLILEIIRLYKAKINLIEIGS